MIRLVKFLETPLLILGCMFVLVAMQSFERGTGPGQGLDSPYLYWAMAGICIGLAPKVSLFYYRDSVVSGKDL